MTFGREIGRAESFALLDHAVERDVRFFDTAAAYGGGASEGILGEWLAGQRARRESFTIATKLLPPYSAAGIEAGLQESLVRLRLERVDLLLLHHWHASAFEPAVLRALDAVGRDGRVRTIGASNFTAPQLADLLSLQSKLGLTPIRTLQNVHNFAVRGFDLPLRELCAQAQVDLLGYSPLGAGFLTGKHRHGVEPGSRFALVPGHQAIYFTEPARERLRRLEQAAAQADLSPAQVALAWALRDSQVRTVLIGGRDAAQLDQAFAARTLVAPAVFSALDADAARTGCQGT